LIPFFRLGEKLFRAPHLPLSVPQIYAMIHANMAEAIRMLWSTTWHAMVVWCLLAPVAAVLVYFVLVPILRRALHRQTQPTTENA
jgi:phosphate/sulfate permease